MTYTTQDGIPPTTGKVNTLALTPEQVAGILADYLRMLVSEIETEDSRYSTVPLTNPMVKKWVTGRLTYLRHISGWLKNHERNRVHSRKHLAWMHREFARLASIGAAKHE